MVDLVQQTLKSLSKGVDGISEEQLKDFKKRKLVNNVYVDLGGGGWGQGGWTLYIELMVCRMCCGVWLVKVLCM